MNRQKPARDEGVLQTPNWPAGADISMSRLALILETPMSLQPEMCGHLAKDCLQAAERTEAPLTRELLLSQAVQWMHDEGIGAEFAPHGPGSALVASFSLPSTSSAATIRTS